LAVQNVQPNLLDSSNLLCCYADYRLSLWLLKGTTMPKYPYEVMFSCARGCFKTLCVTWEEVESNILLYGVDRLMSIQENHGVG
jgi:hypothetical protein